MPRWHLACNQCDAGAWVGPSATGLEGWCESCQSAHGLPPGAGADAACPDCGIRLSTDELRFEEFYGELQNAAAVLAAWDGDPGPLDELLPERPRFLTDLTPPDILPGDPPEIRAALEAVRAGRFAEARHRLEAQAAAPGAEGRAARLWRALGIACERTGETEVAEDCFTRALGSGAAGAEEWRLRLARGCLRARRGDSEGARADFAGAGDGREARWNRSALLLLGAVARTPGLPGRDVIERAHAEAGEPSSYWSDFTVGRLLWTLLVERARAPVPGAGKLPGAGRDVPGHPDPGPLREAEGLFEFDTFWDRALVVHGYATLGMKREASTSASALAGNLLGVLAREPFLRSPPAAPLAAAVLRAAQATADQEPGAALREVRALMGRGDVRRYRVPCARCGRGSIGVDGVEEDETGE